MDTAETSGTAQQPARDAGLAADTAGLRVEIERLRLRICDIQEQASDARQQAREAREEVLRLHDLLAAAQRDQQDLRTARARLSRMRMRGLLARILNTQ